MGFLQRLFFCGCVAVAGSFFVGGGLCAQDLGEGDVLKENLDLPFDAAGNTEKEEENAPEIVVLYGQTFEGDGFVFLGEGMT